MNIVLHVGLHKTGTTFLQKRVFSNMDVNLIVHPKDFLLNLDEDKINLISEEKFSGRPHCIHEKNIRYAYADSLYHMFPDAKIIVGFRDTASWMNSLWKQYIWRGGCKTKDQFLKSFDYSYLDFNSYVDYLKKRFKDVHVYYFEELLKNPDNVIKEISEFIGVEIHDYKVERDNVSFDDKCTKTLRILNKIVWTDEHFGIIPLSIWRMFLELVRFRKGAYVLQDVKK